MAFFAIPIPRELQIQLNEELRFLRQDWPEMHWVHPEDYHLTLRFLGGLAPHAISRVQAEIRKQPVPGASFSVKLRGLSFFPPQRDRGVLWIGLNAPAPEFLRLQAELEDWVQTLGFPAEARLFTPHLTIGRFKNRDAEDLRKLLPGFALRDWGLFSVHEYVLMKRRSGAKAHADRPLYEVLTRIAAAGSGSPRLDA